VDAGGRDLDVTAVAEETAEKAFRHGTAANISRADKEDVFHDVTPAPCRQIKVKLNRVKSTRPGGSSRREIFESGSWLGGISQI
jgi:hypothetical protein